MTIRLKPHQKIHIQSSSDIYRVLQPILLRISKLNRDREHFWLMHLDASQRVRCVELLGLGTQRTVLIDPMDVYHRAIVRRASSIVVIHNHPSGNVKPSHADKIATEKLMQASRFANVRMLDHLIISEHEYYSFLDRGDLGRMAANMHESRIDHDTRMKREWPRINANGSFVNAWA
ncbi:JAB domain-containing protein [Terrimonas sp. NA20]|uniref:JAB domain-containing protein n=1 Tax=Terrimonas ginsenosidimutans TaxID=2908004 RepID=A0ABS9L0L6_9BACT|nr:JAB domain-containing protein [Terrimonas ginsenosidimutans]MCG2618121.1 JAB domain-containing protein [Terrimonas ginsenosidimutans]